MSLLYDLAVQGGPSAVIVAILYVRQTRMMRAMVEIAAEVNGASEQEIRERIRLV